MIRTIKKCKDCGKEAVKEEDLKDFATAKTCTYGVKNLCKKCSALRTLTWKQNNKEKDKLTGDNHRAIKRYGVTLDEYRACMDTSDICEICGSPENLCYDHNHSKELNIKAFRGVLCTTCNSAIGFLKDSEELVYEAYKYLKER